MARLDFKEIKYLIKNKPERYKEYLNRFSKNDIYHAIIEGLREAEESLSLVSSLSEKVDKIRIDELYKEKGERLKDHLN